MRHAGRPVTRSMILEYVWNLSFDTTTNGVDIYVNYFMVQTLASILARMGVQIPTSSVRVNNIAAAFVTASLPPFARPGMRVDVMVSSSGMPAVSKGDYYCLRRCMQPTVRYSLPHKVLWWSEAMPSETLGLPNR